MALALEGGEAAPSTPRSGAPHRVRGRPRHTVLDPTPYRPRTNTRRRERLLKEFAERVGDPETGGSPSKQRLTSYRQDALRCARELSDADVLKVSDLAARTGVGRAGPILRDNHYGWFERVKLGHYSLSPKGQAELGDWSEALDGLAPLP